jgi:hypothetical protein
MLKLSLLSCTVLTAMTIAASLSAQELASHRAAYTVTMLDHGKPAGESAGTYAFEIRRTCEGYVMNQRLRLEADGGRAAIVSEQQSQMTESRDGRKLHFDHRSTANGKVTSQWKGEAILGDDGTGQARYIEPEGQTVTLPAGTMFPAALSRATINHAKAGDTSFDSLFYYGEKVKPPQSVNVLIGRVPKRLADLKIPEGADALVANRTRIYYRGGFFDADAKGKGEQATFEMSSLTLDNGVELYGTHEEGEGGIEYRITRLEALPKPNCN